MHASAGWYGDHTVDAASDGVTVRKGLDLDTLALPALKFEIRSDRDDPVGVRVVDHLPAAVDPDRVGVHADFGADQWTAFEDGRVTFTTRLDPERPVVTLYGIWMDDPGRVHELLKRPEVKVASDPDAPSLDPVGDEVGLPTVDDSLRSVGPSALEDLRADVEDALTGARAEPAEPATALPAPGDGASEDDVAEPPGTMGDHAWAYPVERRGTGRIAAPTHADLDALVGEDGDATAESDAAADAGGRGPGGVGENHVYLRAALTETHHGGGGALLLQELANAFQVVARRVTGDAERATVDAVVETPLGADAVLDALVDREQVTDALVSPLVGDRDDATGIDAEPEDDTEASAREGTEEVSIEPDAEDVEVVLNADGERFSELQAEFERETDTDALEDELADLDLPGVDTSEEPSIDELVDGDDAFDGDDDGGFVPASVDGDDLSFEDPGGADATELDFAADGAVEGDASTESDTDDGTVDADDETAAAGAGAFEFDDDPADAWTDDDPEPSTDEGPFEFAADAAASADGDDPPSDGAVTADPVDATGPDPDATPSDDDTTGPDPDATPSDDDTTGPDPDATASDDDTTGPDPDATASEVDATGSDGRETRHEAAGVDRSTVDELGEPTAADVPEDERLVEVPARELAALRTEMRELRDRVATLESDLAAVRGDLARERGVDASRTPSEGGDSIERLDGLEDD